MGSDPAGDPSVHANELVLWLEQQPDATVVKSAQDALDQMLDLTSQSRQAVGAACVKICGLLQLSSKSGNALLRGWAFREETCMAFLNFFLEWNEKDNPRSMRHVLDVLALLIGQHPSPSAAQSLKANIVETLVSISVRQSTKSMIKSSLTCLQYFLSKSVCTIDEVATIYRRVQPSVADLPSASLWRQFVHEIFAWMSHKYICPVAGKLLVATFRCIQKMAICEPENPAYSFFNVLVWRQWLQDGLAMNPDALEEIKLYIFTPLFKEDRSNSLNLLKSLNSTGQVGSRDDPTLDSATMLQLAALDVGKKYGLVEEPGTISQSKSSDAVSLSGKALVTALEHQSLDIRTFALSVLISSPSKTKPYSKETFALLQKYLPLYYSDPNGKFRSDILGLSKGMAKRIKSAITVLNRGLGQSRDTNQMDYHTGAVPKSTRAGDSLASGKHLGGSLPEQQVMQETLEHQTRFLKWYVDFLRNELAPSASYQRHVTGLKAVIPVLKDFAVANDAVDLATGSLIFDNKFWIRSILDFIVNGFDDVRDTATSILMLFPEEIIEKPFDLEGQTLLGSLEEFCTRASEFASRTARGDHADGAARAQGLLCKWLPTLDRRLAVLSSVLDELERKLSSAENDLGCAVVESPVHGAFASIRYIWEVLSKDRYSEVDIDRLQALERRIFGSCKRIWDIVKDVLCDDSPEGLLPQEMEDIVGLGTKDLLSYAFRAIIESSNTMRAMISNLRFSRARGTLCPSREVFQDVGSLTFVQLSSLRHRGAFSTVAQTFAACCKFSSDPLVSAHDAGDEHSLLMTWYKGTIDCIYAQASTTRRSAGIPALMSGILSANAARPSFEEALDRLEEIALQPPGISEADGSKLPQVHALNCIRDVFRSSLLSHRATRHLPRFLQLGTRCVESEVWAIRNCGLQLLRSLIDCLFTAGDERGDAESAWDGKTTGTSYIKCPTLPNVILDLLKSGRNAVGVESQQRTAEAVFPALDVIRRAGPPDSLRDELYGNVVEYLGNRMWHVRELAAQTISSFLIGADWGAALSELLDASQTSSNRLHGTLLAAKFLIRRVKELQMDNTESHVTQLALALDMVGQTKLVGRCAEVEAAYLDVLNSMHDIIPSPRDISDGTWKPQNASLRIDRAAPSALLRISESVRLLSRATAARDITMLEQLLLDLAASDVDTANHVMGIVPQLWNVKEASEAASRLCSCYMQICTMTDAPDLRAVTLANLASLLDVLLENGKDRLLPKTEAVIYLWNTLQQADINTTLSQAILHVSGPLVAIVIRQPSDMTSEHILRGWAHTISSASDAENTFDTRHAAMLGLKSFIAATRQKCTDPAFLPVALALYDYLIDDDDEIRDMAAAACCYVLERTSLMAGEAAAVLPGWMGQHFGHVPRFQAHAAARMVGHTVPGSVSRAADELLAGWVPAAAQLEAAMRFDASLFAVEKQNLYIDEAREAEQWAGVFARLPQHDGAAASSPSPSPSPALLALEAWTVDGLQPLVALASRDDGPLGWASKADVFATCARILQCGTALLKTKSSRASEVAGLLAAFRSAGEKSRLHGLLLEMADGSEQQ